jgi:hypothetical protein
MPQTATTDPQDDQLDDMDAFVRNEKAKKKAQAPSNDDVAPFLRQYRAAQQPSSDDDDELNLFVKQQQAVSPQQSSGAKLATPHVVADPAVGARDAAPITPFQATVPTTPLDQRAASLGQPSIQLQPPPMDTSKIPLNVFTNMPQAPGMPTQEELPAKAPVAPPSQDAIARRIMQQGNPAELGAQVAQGVDVTNLPTSQGAGADFAEDAMTGSKKLPLPYRAPDGSFRTMPLGDFQKLTDDYLNDPSIPKSRAAAFAAGAGVDAVKTLNDIFFSPMGMASAVTGLAAARALQTAGKEGTAALDLAHEYQAMKVAGASEAELAEHEQLIRQAVAKAASAQTVVTGARVAQKAAGGGFMAQGAGQIITGIQRKNLPTILQGFGGIALGGADFASGGLSDVESQVQAETAKTASENTSGNVSAQRTPVVPAEPTAQQPAVEMPETVTHPVTGEAVSITPDELDAGANSLFGREYSGLEPIEKAKVIHSLTPRTQGESVAGGKPTEKRVAASHEVVRETPRAQPVETPKNVIAGRQSSESPTARQNAASRETPQVSEDDELDSFIAEHRSAGNRPLTEPITEKDDVDVTAQSVEAIRSAPDSSDNAALESGREIGDEKYGDQAVGRQSPLPAVGDRITSSHPSIKGKSLTITKLGKTGVYAQVDGTDSTRFLTNDDYQTLLDDEGKPITTGPGTPLRDAFDNGGTRIQQLAQTIRENASDTKPITERMDYAARAAEASAEAKDETSRALEGVKGRAAGMLDAYKAPPKWTDFEDALGKYQGAIQKSAFGLKHFAREITKAVPSAARREAITNFIEAGGDSAKLQTWAEQGKAKHKPGYRAALTLTNIEKTIARNIIAHQDERFEIDKAAGLLEHEVDNYVMHAWKQENPHTRKLVSNVRAQMLQTKPSFTKQRVFGTFFDGEKAGYAPVNKDIGFLFAAREHAADQAIAARAFIKSMLEGKASDGRPLVAVSGAGRPLAEGDEPPKAYLINATTKSDEIADFRPIDHPALRKWTWAANDAKSNPIFVKGDLVVHPEAYTKLKNILGKSALRSFVPFRVMQRIGAEVKGTLLSFSMFHQTQESLHAIFHRVNPFSTKPIDFSDPIQAKLIDHGLQVASFDAQQEFGEGLVGSNRIPIVGKHLRRYGDFLFSDFIPRLKMAMAQEALGRNLKRYSAKLSEDQIYALTANQANAAFGELNYTMMARNKTFQDVLRMALLAPDFLEARGRFVGQALKPYGREQAVALIVGALGLYVAARILNTLLTGNPRWKGQDAFNVVYKGRTYTLRSVPADIAHLFTDPRKFFYDRLNPVYGRALIEGITGRDQYGHKQSLTRQAKDLVADAMPIPFQGLRKNSGNGPLDTVLSSAGISTYPYLSPAERMARNFALDKVPLGEGSEDRKDANQLARELEDRLRKKQISARDVTNLRKEGKISAADQKHILARAAHTPLQNSFRSLTAQQAIQVWDKADNDERKQIRPLLANKLSRLDSVPRGEREKLKGKIVAALHGTSRPVSSKGTPLYAPGSR